MAKLGDSRDGTDMLSPPPTWLARYRREAELGQRELVRGRGWTLGHPAPVLHRP